MTQYDAGWAGVGIEVHEETGPRLVIRKVAPNCRRARCGGKRSALDPPGMILSGHQETSHEEKQLTRLTMSFAVLLMIGAVATGGMAAAPSREPEQKHAWEWTIAERLAARLDPAKIRLRQYDAEVGNRRIGVQAVAVPRERPGNYSIDGRRNPELLLPHELFVSLMTGFVPDDERRGRNRASLRAGIVSAGFDEQMFWAQLASVASEYAEYSYGDVNPSGAAVSQSHRDPDHGCRLRFDALTAARHVFGQERFDRLLYEVVAPGTQVASATTAAEPSAELRRVAAGCR